MTRKRKSCALASSKPRDQPEEEAEDQANRRRTSRQQVRDMSIRCRLKYSHAGTQALCDVLGRQTIRLLAQTYYSSSSQPRTPVLVSRVRSLPHRSVGFFTHIKRPKFSRCVLNAACNDPEARINPAEEPCSAEYLRRRRQPPGGAAVGETHKATSYG